MFICSDFDALVRFGTFRFVVLIPTSITEFREAVKVRSHTLCTLPDAQKATLAERDIMCPDRNGGLRVLVFVVEAFLVIVESQLVYGYSGRQEMISDELVEQIVLVGIIVVVHGIGIVALFLHPSNHVFLSDVLTVLAQLFFPEFIRFGKECEAILTVLWCRNWPRAQLPVEAWESPSLVEFLVAFIPHLGKAVYQATSFDEACHYAETGIVVEGILMERASQRLVAWIDDVGHLMDEAINRLNVPIAFRDGTNAIDAHTVQIALIIRHANLAVSHRTDLKLLVCLGESSREISLLILCAV